MGLFRSKQKVTVTVASVPRVTLPTGRGNGQRVAGISFYEQDLIRVVGRPPKDGYGGREVVVDLVPRPENEYDPMAVAVYLRKILVGHLHREDLPRCRPIVLDAIATYGHASCAAELVGGWDRGSDDKGHIGLRLSIGDPRQETPPPDANEHRLVPEPFATASVTVIGEEGHQAALRGAAHGRPLTSWLPHVVQLVPLNAAIEVRLDGERVGELTPTMSARYLQLVGPRHGAGWRVTCIGQLYPGEKAGMEIIRIKLSLPKVGSDASRRIDSKQNDR